MSSLGRTLFRALSAVAGLALLAAGAGQEESQPARSTVTVGEALGTVPDLALSGFNYGNSMLVVGSEEEFSRIRVESLRFPPGNQADEIDVAEPDLAALHLNLGLLGDPPVLMVANLFGGTPQQAAERLLLVNSSDGAVETRLDLPEANRAAVQLHLLTLSRPVLDESGEPTSELLQSEAPFFVPARGIVLVAPNADGT